MRKWAVKYCAFANDKDTNTKLSNTISKKLSNIDVS